MICLPKTCISFVLPEARVKSALMTASAPSSTTWLSRTFFSVSQWIFGQAHSNTGVRWTIVATKHRLLKTFKPTSHLIKTIKPKIPLNFHTLPLLSTYMRWQDSTLLIYMSGNMMKAWIHLLTICSASAAIMVATIEQTLMMRYSHISKSVTQYTITYTTFGLLFWNISQCTNHCPHWGKSYTHQTPTHLRDYSKQT